ncbi:hypothetical protein Aeqsu_2106 [Aequorivita sublithincola DSM 14238]|uniref:LamG-like jellyroll fold domain-containing protein n=1 Tax=Aequorivita sublithincola (strain DSM 14238 / LMG 21431 / ACAM 643 / 9-3) TaxID=746697 RepID=I3YX51_AEQSU|nr:LamG domain-containing protein [Aequorivita sublithincola]AFL81569.1 hypothetical protein Aeqsu_2106 [Aequorivita sublithincola DSM 14238]
MKTIQIKFKTLLFALLVGIAFTSCSKDDEQSINSNLNLDQIQGSWTRVGGNQPANNGMKINVSGNSGVITYKAPGNSVELQIGDVKWKDIVAQDETNYRYEELGSNGSYYPSSLTFGVDDTLRISVDAAPGAGYIQKWVQNPSPVSQINDGLVAFYSFCGNANDESNNNNNATIFGATLTEDRYGNSDKAYLFDGINDYMEVENSQSLENLNSQMSMSVWFNTTEYYYTGKGWASLLAKSGNSTSLDSRQFSLFYNDDGDIYFNNDVVGNFSFDLDQWYNLTLTYDSGTVKTYVDGVLINDIAGIEPVVSNQLSLMIGYDTPGVTEYYNGILDDIRIYNRILSESEVTRLTNEDLGCSI